MKRKPNNSDLDFYAAAKKSEECICGRRKAPGSWLCSRCYFGLPDDLRAGLYLKGAAGNEAFDAAVKWLD